MERSFRLRKNDEFQRVYLRGIPAYNRDFKIIGFRNHLEHNRYGFSLSKKFGKANERNRTKRRLREIVRAHQDFFPKSFDYVILPKETAKSLTFSELEQSLLHCLRQWKKRIDKQATRSASATSRKASSSQGKNNQSRSDLVAKESRTS